MGFLGCGSDLLLSRLQIVDCGLQVLDLHLKLSQLIAKLVSPLL
jgi:hypothetical protein